MLRIPPINDGPNKSRTVSLKLRSLPLQTGLGVLFRLVTLTITETQIEELTSKPVCNTPIGSYIGQRLRAKKSVLERRTVDVSAGAKPVLFGGSRPPHVLPYTQNSNPVRSLLRVLLLH